MRRPGPGEGVVDVGVDPLALAEQQRRRQRRDPGVEPLDQPGAAPGPHDAPPPGPGPGRGRRRAVAPDSLPDHRRPGAGGSPAPCRYSRTSNSPGLSGPATSLQAAGRLDRLARDQVGPRADDDQQRPPRGAAPVRPIAHARDFAGPPGSVPDRRDRCRARRARPRAPRRAGAAPRHSAPDHRGPGPTSTRDATPRPAPRRPPAPPGSARTAAARAPRQEPADASSAIVPHPAVPQGPAVTIGHDPHRKGRGQRDQWRYQDPRSMLDRDAHPDRPMEKRPWGTCFRRENLGPSPGQSLPGDQPPLILGDPTRFAPSTPSILSVGQANS